MRFGRWFKWKSATLKFIILIMDIVLLMLAKQKVSQWFSQLLFDQLLYQALLYESVLVLYLSVKINDTCFNILQYPFELTSEMFKCDFPIVCGVTVHTHTSTWSVCFSRLLNLLSLLVLGDPLAGPVLLLHHHKPLALSSVLPTHCLQRDPDHHVWRKPRIRALVREELRVPGRSLCSVVEGWGSPL